MDRLLYSSLSAMRSTMARQTAVANNLANANTTGFKSEITAAQSLWLRGPGLETRAFSSQSVLAADTSAGAITHTGRDLDVAMNNDAMLAVQAEDGSEAYTRAGDLQLSDSGLLTTRDGQPVLGDSGPITLPPADQILIGGDGKISIIPQGGDPTQPQEVDHLKLASPKGSVVEKGLDGLFRVKAGGTLPSDPDATLTSQSLEQSNVNASQALIEMIDAGRAWEQQVKMMASMKDLDTSATEIMRLPD